MRKALERMYTSFILPLLEYCDSVWDNASLESKKKLDGIHIEATKLCSIEKLLVELGWDTLQSSRNKHKLVTFYKIIHGLSPNYLQNLIPLLSRKQTITILGMPTTSKPLPRTPTSSTIPSSHLLFEHGMLLLEKPDKQRQLQHSKIN